MKETIIRLDQLIESGLQHISDCSKSELSHKPNANKWSKKEIIGHLIDSGIHNLQRFTEIQYENKPYKIRKYFQDGLVIANDYQNVDIDDRLAFWIAVNNQIRFVMKMQTSETLSYPIELSTGVVSDLRFLITDYVDHLEHHLNQIKSC